MFNMIRTVALSAAVGLGALAAAPATAQADSFYFGITPNGPTFGFHGDSSRRVYRDRDHRRDDRRGRYDRRDRGGCSERAALRKADRMGIHRARVRSSDRFKVRVSGRKRGEWISVTFANQRSCPLITY